MNDATETVEIVSDAPSRGTRNSNLDKPETYMKKYKTPNRVASSAVLGDVWILEEGEYYNDRGLVVCAAKSKAALLRWIKAEYPKHHRNTEAKRNGEIFFENDEQRTWLRCERNDKCPLVA